MCSWGTVISMKNKKTGEKTGRGLWCWKAFILCGFCSCVSTAPPAPDTGTLWGYFTLKPREGVKPGGGDGSGYSDRRYRDVEYVNYRDPGFAVVYLEGPPPTVGAVNVTLEQTRRGLDFNTRYSAVGVGGTVNLKNLDRENHIFSCPMANFMRRLGPGENAAITIKNAGEYAIFVLDYPGTKTTVFAAPGPFSLLTRT